MLRDRCIFRATRSCPGFRNSLRLKDIGILILIDSIASCSDSLQPCISPHYHISESSLSRIRRPISTLSRNM